MPRLRLLFGTMCKDYAFKLESVDPDVDLGQLISLREAQLMYRLSDELVEDMFRKHTRKLLEQNISTALSILKSRSRDGQRVIEEIDKILAFNNLLISRKSHPDASRFAHGVGPVSLIATDLFLASAKASVPVMGDASVPWVSDYYNSIFLCSYCGFTELLAAEELVDAMEVDGRGRGGLRRWGLVARQNSVSSGDLAAADSKAAYLQNLCEELHFDPEKAIEIHEGIYRRKLPQLVADKGELSDHDVKILERIQIMFCVPKQTVEAAHADICGSLFEKVIKEAIAAGVDGYDAEVKKSVRKAAFGLRLTRGVAMSIASKAVRKIFISYIQRARVASNRTESAKELKKMIAFNSLVVTELVANIKGESTDTPPKEPIEEEEKPTEVDEEWESLQSLRKARPSKESMGKPSQTEINLKDDLPERDRTDLYKTYLLFCLTGEVTRIPFGVQITTKKDDSEYVLLNQLGGILGLSDTEIVDIHRSLAEQAFRQEAEVILADGQLTKARIEQLNELQKNVGLPPQYSQKIIKEHNYYKIGSSTGNFCWPGEA
ncbi:Protein TIC110, chloroplastic [Olea europaea subsp. europaea]|uniref:Protein TIC110, chloroplastic n=1 Tax=Olea europaea subsp. europaea TaxID=158383 RepID=A0A8S0PIL8_OLEEU|nr:Protein TIC110, chloroplastic [Olea europaea subsp. europaea]